MTYRPWLPIAFYAAAVLFLGLQPTNRDVVAAMQRGDELAAGRHYGAALDAYETAARQCPGCPQPRQRQGSVYLTQERYEEAWGAYLDAIRVGGADDQTQEGLARLYAAQGNQALAIEILERMAARRPERAGLWTLLAEAALGAGDEARAKSTLARALELDLSAGQQQAVHDQLGILCVEDDISGAISHFEAAARGPDPDVAHKATRLASALRMVGESDEPALAHARLGEALLRHGDLQLARRAFEMAVELAPEYVDGHAYLGHILSVLGEDECAVHHLDQAIALEPAYPLPYYFLGMHYVRKGWLVTGQEVLLRAHDLDPLDPAICAAVADTFLRADLPEYAAAERWLHAAVDRAPDDPRFHLLLAHLYVDYNVDPALRGVAVAQVAAQLDPENSEAQETLGWGYHLGGYPGAALDPLLRARDLGPPSARIQYRLGQVYRALGRMPEAREAYQQAIDLDWTGPVGERARQALGQ